jgi:hypothetical protein
MYDTDTPIKGNLPPTMLHTVIVIPTKGAAIATPAESLIHAVVAAEKVARSGETVYIACYRQVDGAHLYYNPNRVYHTTGYAW